MKDFFGCLLLSWAYMNNPEHIILVTVFVLAWIFWMVSVIHFYRYGDRFFGLLSEKFPEYYASIGKPKYFTFRFLNTMRAQSYLQDLLLKGMPKDLPDDKDIRRMAGQVRKLDLRLYLLFIAFFVLILILGLSKG